MESIWGTFEMKAMTFPVFLAIIESDMGTITFGNLSEQKALLICIRQVSRPFAAQLATRAPFSTRRASQLASRATLPSSSA